MSAVDVDEILEHQLNANMLLMPYHVYSDLFDSIDSLGVEIDNLRELAKEMWSVMWACTEERCTHRENGCYRVSGNGTAPKGHGECWFKQRMRELGVE